MGGLAGDSWGTHRGNCGGLAGDSRGTRKGLLGICGGCFGNFIGMTGGLSEDCQRSTVEDLGTNPALCMTTPERFDHSKVS